MPVADDPVRMKSSEMAETKSAGSPVDYVLKPPPRPSFGRWKRLAFSRLSLIRALEYEAISSVAFSGKVLDIGGDRRSGYPKFIQGSLSYETVNFNSEASPTFQLDLERELPLADGSYSHVISVNTFEHIFNDQLAVSEAIRVLSPGGTFHFFVPFLYRVHGSPRDFHRHTPEWWGSTIRQCGIPCCQIIPLVWGKVTSGASVAGTGRLVRAAAMLFDMADVRYLLARSAEQRARSEQIRTARLANIAAGYHVSGTKPLAVA